MIKRISIYISTLVCFTLVISTGIYFYQSKIVIEKEILSQANLLNKSGKDGVEKFLSYIKSITFIIHNNEKLRLYLQSPSSNDKLKIEDLFITYSNKINSIQAIRLIDLHGNIKIFIKEKENLSSKISYKDINLSNKDFLSLPFRNGKDSQQVYLSNFERGKLPDTDNFCPSMIRAVTVYHNKKEILGYLVVNFWGNYIGELLGNIPKENGYSFIVEINNSQKERDGIFLFHQNKKLEFANQYKSSYTLDSVYHKNISKIIRENTTGIIKMSDSSDYISYDTIYPYDNTNQIWKICTLIKGDYYYRNIKLLRNNFLSVMLFSIFMSIITSAYISKKLLKPMNKITEAMTELGKGHLNTRIDHSTFDQELSIIAETVNKMATSLQIHIEEIQNKQQKIEILNRLSSIGLLSAGIAHELNTPLNSILITCNLLEKSITEEQNIKDINTIKNETLRCVSTINALKNITPQNTENIQLEEVKLKEVLNKISQLITIGEDINIYYELSDVSILGNQQLIQTAVLNIVTNAVEAVYPKGNIHIRLYNKNKKAIIEIEDNGKGLNEESKKHLFSPFYSTKNSNMGMGLPLVYRIITIHKGEITVESSYGIGTKFILEFDCYDKCIDSRR